MTLDRALSALGRTFIGAGLLIFLFIAYQLWGTGLRESRAQDELQAEASQLFAAVGAPPPSTAPPSQSAPSTTQPPNTTPAPPPAPAGSAVAVIRIPKIDVQKAVVAGTDVNHLKRGPGHYTGTPLPGQRGNAGIAGHRTTYGAPFGRLDELNVSDQIEVATRQGVFVYRVTNKKVVDPGAVEVLNQPKDANATLLTLTTCHPRFSAAKRLIITATLAPGVSPAPARQTTTTSPPTTTKPAAATTTTTSSTTVAPPPVGLAGDTLPGDGPDKTPAILWGVATTFVGLMVWVLSVTWRRWPAYIFGAPVFLLILFIFFENFSRLLPESY